MPDMPFMPRRAALVLVLLGLSPAGGRGAAGVRSNPYYEFLLARRLEGDGDSRARSRR